MMLWLSTMAPCFSEFPRETSMAIATPASFQHSGADRATTPVYGACWRSDLGESALWAQLCDEVEATKAPGQDAKPVITGPLTYLWLSQVDDPAVDKLGLLESVLPVYAEFLGFLAAQGVEWIQIDESILTLDLPQAWKSAFERAYHILQYSPLKKLLATSFDGLQDNLGLAANLPVQGLHVDAVQAPEQLGQVLDRLPTYKILSVGLVNGRNAWRCELERAMAQLQSARERFGDNLWVGGSCLVPDYSTPPCHQAVLDPELNNPLAFALRKGGEIAVQHEAR